MNSLCSQGKPVRLFPWALIFASLLFVGCVDIEQSFVVKQDAAVYGIEMRANQALLQLDPEAEKKFCDENDQLITDLRPELTREVSRFYEGDDVICRMAVSGPLNAFAEGMSLSGHGSLSKTLSFEWVAENTLRITSQFGANQKVQQSSPEQRAVIAAMFQGRELSWRIEAPRVLKADGEISSDARRVEWSVPLYVAMTEPQRFAVTVMTDVPWYQPALDWLSR